MEEKNKHARLDDVLLRANELGIEYHPVGLKGGISIDAFNVDKDEQGESKTFEYASVERDSITVYESLYDVFDDNKGVSLAELPEDAQQEVVDRLFDSFFAENDQMVVVYDKQEVPSYALGALINGDFSGIEDPDDEQNIRDFMDEKAGYIIDVNPDSVGFNSNPAFGLPTDCETAFFVKPVTPKELLEQQKVGMKEQEHFLEPLTDEQWKMMSEIGYPYAPGNAKEHEAAPIPDMIYWRLAAGMMTKDDAVRAFSTTGYTIGRDPERTNEILAELNIMYQKLDNDFKPLTAGDKQENVFVQQKELGDAKENLMNTLNSARTDLGDTIFIKPTPVKLEGNAFAKATGVFLAPDGKGGGEFRLSGEHYAVLAVESDGHTEFDVTKILDNASSVNALTKAVHDAHIDNLEQKSKEAIHDRIINSWQRNFTPNQVDVLNRYHQIAAPDTPAHELFSHLLREVSQKPDVARKPEKWIADTAKELDEVAKGNTREEVQGLKR